MKKILILLLLITKMFSCSDKDVYDGIKMNIHVETAGTLSTSIKESDKYQIISLKLTGNLNGTDIRFIREMAGRNIEGEETAGRLSVLDLSGANIVYGGDYYYCYYCDDCYDENYYTSDNTIGSSAFSDCTSLTNITIPNNITTIRDDSFRGCISLTSITIGNVVTSIGGYAFSDCTSLKEIHIDNPVPQRINSRAFYGVNKKTCNLYVPKGSYNAYKNAPVWSEFVNIIEK